MPRGRADIANMALRIFLTQVGENYDRMRGLRPYAGKRAWRAILDDFDGCCCYCGLALTEANATEDHLVPINKSAIGLHAWGNVVPACAPCNARKHGNEWHAYVRSISDGEAEYERRVSRVAAFQEKYRYAPGVGLAIVADTLYEEVGALAVLLIDLKIKRAGDLIAQLGRVDPAGDGALATEPVART